MSNDPYHVLKVHPSSKLEDIKKAYRELVKIYHPDKGGDAKVILEINAAWESLKKTHNDRNINKFNDPKVYSKHAYKKEKNHSKNLIKFLMFETIPNDLLMSLYMDLQKHGSDKIKEMTRDKKLANKLLSSL